MHRLPLCRNCLRHINTISHGFHHNIFQYRCYSGRWFALYEDVQQIPPLPLSQLPTLGTSLSRSRPRPSQAVFSENIRSRDSPISIPTSADRSELGGVDLSEGLSAYLNDSSVDVDALLATIEEANLELARTEPTPSPAPSPSAHRPSRVPRGKGVRSRFSRKGQPTEELQLTHDVVDVQIVEPEREQLTRFVANPLREGTLELSELMQAVKEENLETIRSLLSSLHWPSPANLTPPRACGIFELIFSKALDCEECRQFVMDYASSSPRSCLPSPSYLSLARRVVEEQDVPAAMRALRETAELFHLRPASTRALRRAATDASRALFAVAAQRGSVAECERLFATAQDTGCAADAKIFVRQQLECEMQRSNWSFSEFLSLFRRLNGKYSCVEGVDLAVEGVFRATTIKEMESRLKKLSALVRATSWLDPADVAAQLLVALLRQRKYSVAESILLGVSLPARHFFPPLRILADEVNVLASSGEGPSKKINEESSAADGEDTVRQSGTSSLLSKGSEDPLVVVESLARLVSTCFFGEVRRGRREKKAEVDVEEQEKELLSVVHSQVLAMFGVTKTAKKGKGGKPMRKVKVDAEQLHQLAVRIQTVWANVADASGNTDSMKRMLEWSTKHRLVIPDTIQKRHGLPTKD